MPNTTNQQEKKKKIELEHNAKKWFELNKPNELSDFKSIHELLDTVNAWNTMLHLHGPKDTLEYLSLRNYNDQSVQFLVANLDLPAEMDRTKDVKQIMTNVLGMSTDRIDNQSLLTTINYLNKMLEINGPNETLDFLASCGYRRGTIQFLTANLNLPNTFCRANEANKINNKNVTSNKDFKSNYSLLHTIDSLNKMLTVHGPNETLRFLATCDYSDQNIKFLTANLHLPQSMDKATEANKIIAVPKVERISDFSNNHQLIININIWIPPAKNKGIDYVLSQLSQTSYRAKSIKLIVANLPLPESMDKVAESNKIIEQTNKNVIAKFKKELPNLLEEKKLNLQTLNHIIHSFDLPANEAKSLTQYAVFKAQEIHGQDIQAYLREKVQQTTTEQAQLKLTDSLKQLQQKPNDIEIYLNKEDLKGLKEKATNKSSNTNRHLPETSKNKQESSLHR